MTIFLLPENFYNSKTEFYVKIECIESKSNSIILFAKKKTFEPLLKLELSRLTEL